MTDYNFQQEITLPSRGYFNPEIPDGKVVQRCLMVSDQKFLSGSNMDSKKMLSDLIKRTTVTPEDLDSSNLTLGDTLYLLFKLRILSYGNEYKFRTRCPECGKKIEVTADLSELPVEFLEEGFEEKLVTTLPHSKATVWTSVQTNFDLEEIDKECKRRRKKNPNDDSEYILRIAQSVRKIKTAEGKELTSRFDIERFVGGLTDLDAMTILAARDSVQFGILPTVEHTCTECRETIEVGVYFSGDFFRPNLN